jgi:hypothetical protein
MIWLLPLAAAASLDRSPGIPAAIAVAAGLTPGYYPSPEYHGTGLDLVQTLILVIRNCILVVAWGMLLCESFMPMLRARK